MSHALSTTEPSARERLSAWMDGEPGEHDAASALDKLADEPDLLADWHCYHLVGDVLRSQDLACAAPAESALLWALRERLATEPQPMVRLEGPSAGRFRAMRRPWMRAWQAPMAAAAGFVLVGAWVWPHRAGLDAERAAPTLQAAASVPADVVRNARLDRYVQAHRAWAQGVAADAPMAQRFQVNHEVR